MFFDKNLMFFDGDAGSAVASSSIDLGTGPVDEKLDIYFAGVGMTAGTNLVIEHSADDVTFTQLLDVTVGFAVLNTGYVVRLPPNIERYVTLTVTGGAGGTMTAGIVKDAQMSY